MIINNQVVASATKKSSTISTTSPHQYHQRSCSMQQRIMIPDDNLSGIIAGIHHPPKICIDYLSHEWTKEDDIWTSWKVMSKQKKAFANGVRLENASWRTWAKQKYNLKTVNPEKLNWYAKIFFSFYAQRFISLRHETLTFPLFFFTFRLKDSDVRSEEH